MKRDLRFADVLEESASISPRGARVAHHRKLGADSIWKPLHTMTTLAQASEVYLVPRNGTIESVTLIDHDDLRRFRTELEILRRIARNVSSMRLLSPRQNAEDPDLQRELFNALKDATNPVVEEAIALIDTQNPDLRKELFMSVINEEAENIVQEALESGVAAPTGAAKGETAPINAPVETPSNPTDQTQTDSPNPAADTEPPAQDDPPVDATPPADAKPELPVEEALAQAQEELAKAVETANTEQPANPPTIETTDATNTDPDTDPDLNPTPDQSQTPTIETADAGTGITDATEFQEDQPAPDNSAAGIEAQLDACLDTKANDPVTDEGYTHETEEAPYVPVEESAATTFDDASPFAEYTADKATAAVEEIERGIRKLADVLNNDVSTQWKKAQDAFVEVMEARTKAGTLHQEATQMTSEIARLKEEIEIARDDADIARREAKLMREDALQAKRRAEDFANAAQRCANEM